jgi:hypothetical protein
VFAWCNTYRDKKVVVSCAFFIAAALIRSSQNGLSVDIETEEVLRWKIDLSINFLAAKFPNLVRKFEFECLLV